MANCLHDRRALTRALDFMNVFAAYPARGVTHHPISARVGDEVDVLPARLLNSSSERSITSSSFLALATIFSSLWSLSIDLRSTSRAKILLAVASSHYCCW
jgi:hypothetical protein